MSFLFPNTNAVAQCLPHVLPNCYTDEFHDVLSIVSRDNPERLVIFADWALLVPEVPLRDTHQNQGSVQGSAKSKQRMKWDLSQGLNKQKLMLFDMN